MSMQQQGAGVGAIGGAPAEQERLLAVATVRRESPRPNATTTVCDTLDDQAIRRISEQV